MNVKKSNAITLIALIITIIVLLILAGVSLSMVFGQNGVIDKAQASVNKYQSSSKNEQGKLDKMDEYLSEPKGPKIEVIEGTLGGEDWYKSDVKVKITSEKTIGTAIKYYIEGANQAEMQEMENGGEIILGQNGTSTVVAMAKNAINGESEESRLEIKIDKIPSVPKIEIIEGTLGGGNYYRSSVKVKITSEKISEATIKYHIEGANQVGEQEIENGAIVTLSTNGISTIIATAKYGIYEEAEESKLEVKIDNVAPVVTNYWWAGANTNGASLYVQVSDNASGITSIQCPSSTQLGGYSNWVWINPVWDASANAYRADVSKSYFGATHDATNYKTHIYLYDTAGNGGFSCETSTVYIPHVHTSACYGTKTVYGVYKWNGKYSSNGFGIMQCTRCGNQTINAHEGQSCCSGTVSTLICGK